MTSVPDLEDALQPRVHESSSEHLIPKIAKQVDNMRTIGAAFVAVLVIGFTLAAYILPLASRDFVRSQILEQHKGDAKLRNDVSQLQTDVAVIQTKAANIEDAQNDLKDQGAATRSEVQKLSQDMAAAFPAVRRAREKRSRGH